MSYDPSLRGFLDEHSAIEWVSSSLVEIETYRALVRATGPADMPALIDAIHLATGLRLRDQQRLTSFVTYDKRLAEAASSAGLAVDMPTD